MNIVIIEDESFTANDLAETLLSLEPDVNIIEVLSSVKSAVSYFTKNGSPDLIYSDIQLGDGLSFEIFKAVRITAPVIFCTAYDEYAMNAFKANGIDYILKPYSEKQIAESLEKFKTISFNAKNDDVMYKELIDSLINRKESKKSSVLVHFKDKILPVRIDEIALFYIENEVVTLITLDKKKYTITKSLDELSQLCGDNYFRVNRQYLVNRKSVIDASQYFGRKLIVNVKVPVGDKITVSKGKVAMFLKWLEQQE